MRAAEAVGVAALLAGFLSVFQRGIAGLFDFSYAFVTLVGVLAAVQGIRYVSARRRTEYVSLDLGDPEERYVVDVPGAEVDDWLRRVDPRSRGGSRFRNRLRERLREAAADRLVATRGYTPAEAEAALADGSWTDDAAAAAFLAPSLGYPFRTRVRVRLRGGSLFRHGVDRTVTALREEGDGS
ncbi:DUF7269 family protein [Haloparvum sedimenti]|uniref:DUF7269 family protein n=1 Tax=Haloparvum sedimenti TaxID=1678448 RepID=UPI0009B5AA4B|nr:hypothetical protein [Haloparvum sedimenti]